MTASHPRYKRFIPHRRHPDDAFGSGHRMPAPRIVDGGTQWMPLSAAAAKVTCQNANTAPKRPNGPTQLCLRDLPRARRPSAGHSHPTQSSDMPRQPPCAPPCDSALSAVYVLLPTTACARRRCSSSSAWCELGGIGLYEQAGNQYISPV